ncbi:SRPBCC family protein [Rubritalea tangerina]|uniref:SRPBCC family protein n=1 Tax=Rubritalea tangerina TaxID=430798 RepID=A0ABW4ZB61_9BACT
MPSFSVSESITIKEKREDVYAFLRDLKNWPEWSPWIICDPECRVDFGNHRYTWEGAFVGVGEMEIAKETPHESIAFALVFQKPWRSRAQVEMRLSELDGGTEVRWTMASKLPFFLFWLKPTMVQLVRMDYQRGLKMLKELLETGVIHSTLDFVGEQEIAGCPYIGIERHCAIDAMETAMEEDFGKLMEWAAKEENKGLLAEASRKPFTIYRKWDLKQGLVHYRVCHPLKESLSEVPYGFESGERAACRAYVVGHTGAYRHLGNAWSAAMLRARARLFKQSKEVMPFEKYVSMPGEVGEASTVTLICLPLK